MLIRSIIFSIFLISIYNFNAIAADAPVQFFVVDSKTDQVVIGPKANGESVDVSSMAHFNIYAKIDGVTYTSLHYNLGQYGSEIASRYPFTACGQIASNILDCRVRKKMQSGLVTISVQGYANGVAVTSQYNIKLALDAAAAENIPPSGGGTTTPPPSPTTPSPTADPLPAAISIKADRTYFVDYESGLDSHSGLTPQTAFKHFPQDINATGTAKATQVLGGSKFIFKGGVKYKSVVSVQSSGTDQKPVILDGNTENTFGSGRAIIDGSETLVGAQRISTSATGYAVYQAPLPDFIKNLATRTYDLNLHQDLKQMKLAQSPNTVFSKRVDLDLFYSVPQSQMTAQSLVDKDRLNSLGIQDWSEVRIIIWHKPNVVSEIGVSSYNASTGLLTFSQSIDSYLDRPTKYAVINSSALLDQPGEYLVNYNRGLVTFIPPDGSLTSNLISVAKRPFGIDLAANYIVAQNFILQKHIGRSNETHSGSGVRAYSGSSDPNSWRRGLFIQYNWSRQNTSITGKGGIYGYGIRDSLIQKNRVDTHEGRGIFITRSLNIAIDSNYVTSVTGTNIGLYQSVNPRIVRNVVAGAAGVHANGITLYLSCENAYVAYNKVSGGNIALTTQDGINITVAFAVTPKI